MLMLICGRVVQGMGGGGMISSAQMVLGDMAPPKERAKYYTYFSIAFTTAGGCGPALGGWICDHLLLVDDFFMENSVLHHCHGACR